MSRDAEGGRAASPHLIVHVLFSFSVGGLENGVVNLINQLPASRWRHAVIALSTVSDNFRTRVERPGTLFYALGKPPGHAFRLYPRLYRLFRDLRPAIVHSRNLAALESLVPAAVAGVPVRIHGEHGRDVGDVDGFNRKYQMVRRLYAPFATRFVAVSKDLERYLRERVGIPARKIDQVYNGVDTQRFRPASGGRTPAPGCPFSDPDLWLVGSVGRMESVKDHTNLARAFAHVVSMHAEARRRMRLVLVGEGTLRAQVEQVLSDADALGLTWFTGERADVPDLMRGLDCFVLPSLAEGISNTILEAMATGLPVVATRVGGNPELVEDGATGRLVPAADPVSLSAAILEQFSNPSAAMHRGRAGRQRVEMNFSIERMVERYDRLYAGALGLHGSVRRGPDARSRLGA